MPLTPSQALKAARELRSDFGDHAEQRLRRLIRQRKVPVDWEALGLEPKVANIAPYQSDTPNQEAHRYANALSGAEPEVAVFVSDSEKATRQKIGENLEQFYDAMVQVLLGDDYLRCLLMASEGMGAGRLDLKPAFWKGIPQRGDLDNEKYNVQVDDQRRFIGLPFEFVNIDPLTLFYEEDKRQQVTVGAEWGRRKQSVVDETYQKGKNGRGPEQFLGPTVPESSARAGGTMVDFVVVRTPEVIYHAVMGQTQRQDKVLWEGPNLFAPSTGYILWRGLPSGFSELDQRYHPFIMQALNVAQQWNLLVTLQTNFAIMATRVWTEEPPEAGQARGLREVAAEAKGMAKTKRSQHGNVAADMETGRIVRWREVSGDIREVISRLELEEARYRFPEPLAPESSTGESGRDTIRRQEASSRLLKHGFDARKQAIEELIRVCRQTLFGHKDFLAAGRRVYLPHLAEGLGDEGTLRAQDVISISEDDNIPHEVQVTVATETLPSRLALNEEGIRMEGRLSRDTIDQDYYGVKNIPLENRRRQKDLIRVATYPETVKRAIQAVNARLGEHQPPEPDLIVPAGGNGSAPVPGPAISAQPNPPQLEDVGLAMGTDGGVGPLVEGT